MMKSYLAATCSMGLALAVLAGSATAAPYVETMQGTRIEGTEIRAKSDGSIVLQTPQGSRTFSKGQYRRAYADKPAEIDRAAALVKAKDYAGAADLLEKVVSQYKFLGWDVQAMKLLPKVYMAEGNSAKAVTALESLFRFDREAAADEDLKWEYMKALVDDKQYSKVESQLDEIIAKGSRTDAARAQIMRGDMQVAKGQLEDAVLDYMRTVVLFAGEKEQQPEAIFKTAETLEKLRDSRAKDFYKKVADEYAGSPYGIEARKKL